VRKHSVLELAIAASHLAGSSVRSAVERDNERSGQHGACTIIRADRMLAAASEFRRSRR
jgi:hypothetical protein